MGARRPPLTGRERSATWTGLHALAALLALSTGAGCTETARGERSPRAESGGVAAPPRYAVQIASLMDSAAAERMRDSLAERGWEAYIDRAQIGTRRAHHVRVLTGDDAALAGLAIPLLRMSGATATEEVRETGRHDALARLLVVRTHPSPMTGARWAVSADSAALMVVDEGTSAGGDALPLAFVLAGDGDSAALHVEGVWDVAPAPDWRSAAYGIAYVAGPTGAPADAGRWSALASAAAVSDVAARGAAFPVPGRTARQGLARLVVARRRAGRSEPDALPGEWSGPRGTTAPMGGWRVRWSAASDTVYALARPLGAAPPAEGGWGAFDPMADTLIAEGGEPGPDRTRWTRPGEPPGGSARARHASGSTFAGARWTVQGDGVWLRARRSAGADQRWRIIGPGTPVAITRSGSVVAALAPRFTAAPLTGGVQEVPAHAVPVVYLLPP